MSDFLTMFGGKRGIVEKKASAPAAATLAAAPALPASAPHANGG